MLNVCVIILIFASAVILNIDIKLALFVTFTTLLLIASWESQIDKEHFSNEAVQSIASMYNNSTLTATNANISGTLTTGKITSGEIASSAKVGCTELTTPKITPSGGPLTIAGDVNITGKLTVNGRTHLKEYLVLTGWTGCASKDIYNDYQTPNTVIMGGTNENGNAYWWGPRREIKMPFGGQKIPIQGPVAITNC